jgi:hypothetical protein
MGNVGSCRMVPSRLLEGSLPHKEPGDAGRRDAGAKARAILGAVPGRRCASGDPAAEVW